MKNSDRVVTEKKPPTKEQKEYVEKLCKNFLIEAKSKPDLLSCFKDGEKSVLKQKKNLE